MNGSNLFYQLNSFPNFEPTGNEISDAIPPARDTAKFQKYIHVHMCVYALDHSHTVRNLAWGL